MSLIIHMIEEVFSQCYKVYKDYKVVANSLKIDL